MITVVDLTGDPTAVVDTAIEQALATWAKQPGDRGRPAFDLAVACGDYQVHQLIRDALGDAYLAEPHRDALNAYVDRCKTRRYKGWSRGTTGTVQYAD